MSFCFVKGCAVCSPNIFRNTQLYVQLLFTLYFLRHIKLPYWVGGCCSDLIRHNVTCRKSCFTTPSFVNTMAATINYSTCLKVIFAVLADFTTRRQPHPAALLCTCRSQRLEIKVGGASFHLAPPPRNTVIAYTALVYLLPWNFLWSLLWLFSFLGHYSYQLSELRSDTFSHKFGHSSPFGDRNVAGLTQGTFAWMKLN